MMRARFGVAWVFWIAMGWASQGLAQSDRWTSFGPGRISLGLIDSSSSGVLYATSVQFRRELWRLRPGRSSWEWLGNGLRGGLVYALGVHPKRPAQLWVASSEFVGSPLSISRSTDGGATFARISPLGLPFFASDLAVVPLTQGVALLGVNDVAGPSAPVFRSTDQGASWKPIAGIAHPVASSPDDPGVVYARRADSEDVVRSTDGGATFSATQDLPIEPSDEMLDLHVTYGRSPTIFVTFRTGGLFRSDNRGATWRRVGFARFSSRVTSEPNDPQKVYVAHELGLFESAAGGRAGSFRQIASAGVVGFFPPPTAVVAAAGGPYVAAEATLLEPGERSSYALTPLRGIQSYGVQSLSVHPLDPSRIAVLNYLGCIEAFCDTQTHLSTDGGITFERRGDQVQARRFVDVYSFAFDFESRERWIEALGGLAGLHEDDASPKKSLTGPFGVSAVAIANGGALIVGDHTGIERSTDSGQTWQVTLPRVIVPSLTHPFGGTLSVSHFEVARDAPRRLAAYAYEKRAGQPRDPGSPVTYLSSDGGATWIRRFDRWPALEFVPGSSSGLLFLAQTASGVELRVSEDDGASSAIRQTFSLADAVRDLAIDPNDPLVMYAATRQGATMSRDGGLIWTPVAGGFRPWGQFREALRSITTHPSESGRIFASPIEGGLFQNRVSGF